MPALRYKWMAVSVGIMLTAAPLLWLTSWLQRHGEAEAGLTAQWAVGTTELTIGRTADSLRELATQNVHSCEPPHVERLRRALFAGGPIKELGIVDAGGQTLCTDVGRSFAARDVLASAATPDPEIMLDVVRIVDSDERMLRVRRLASQRAPMLAALLQPAMLLPQVSPAGGAFTGYARMALADGTLIGSTGGDDVLRQEHALGRARSGVYGPVVTVAMQRSLLPGYDDLRWIGVLATASLAVMLLLCAVLVARRFKSTENPTSEIERALAAGEFIPYYQPIVDIASGKLLGCEVLVRWKKSDGNIVAPGAFIPMIESSGLVLDMTRALMHQVCIEIGPTIEARPDMYVTFNVAPRHLRDSMILNDVGAIFEGSPIRLSQVVLELTERYELENLNAARRVIAALQALGCRVALDDVGTGHSGLSYILKLGVDIIKIDRLFVEAIKTDPQTQAIVGTLVDLARNLRMKIVAEGVEHFEQVTYLRQHGIVAAQGYCFAPPLPASAFVQLVQATATRSTAGGKAALESASQGHASSVAMVDAAA